VEKKRERACEFLDRVPLIHAKREKIVKNLNKGEKK